MSSRWYRFCSVLMVCLWLLVPAVVVSGQAAVVALVEYTSSDDIIIIRNSRRLSFTDSFGLELFSGDQVQTGRSVAMEIRFIRNNAVVKITENTTFVLEAPSATDTGLRLVYGRVRAKVERLTGTETFSVQSSGAVAGVRGTDFGYDYIAMRNTAVPVPRIYCFEGVVEVTALVRTPATMAQNMEPLMKRFVLDAGSMVEVQAPGSTAETLKTEISEDVRSFWMQNDFQDELGVPPAPQSLQPQPAELATTQPKIEDASQTLSAPTVVAPDQPSVLPTGQFAPTVVVETQFVYVRDEVYAAKVRQASSLKNGGIIAGMNLIGIGLGLNLYGLYLNQVGNPAAMQYLLSGSLFSAAAVPFLLVTFLVKP